MSQELGLLGLTPEPQTLWDLLLVGCLAARNVSWLLFARLLRGQAELATAEWDALWPLIQGGDALPWPDQAQDAALVRGSNSATVSAARSYGGAGLIASDPHLTITLPPLWLVTGLHGPGLDVVGLICPACRWSRWGATTGLPGAAPACMPPAASWSMSRPSR